MTEEQRDKRMFYHLYESDEGILEHAERIVALEELLAAAIHAMWACDNEKCPYGGDCDEGIDFMPSCKIVERARELGIEVE